MCSAKVVRIKKLLFTSDYKVSRWRFCASLSQQMIQRDVHEFLRIGAGTRIRFAFRSRVVRSDVVSQPLGIRVFRFLLQKLVVLDRRKVFASREIVDSG